MTQKGYDMCNGLAANNPGERYPVIQVHCLDHARRQFCKKSLAYKTDNGTHVGDVIQSFVASC